MYTKSSTLWAALMLLAVAGFGAAQEPVKLPAVKVNAAPPPPGRNILVGAVRDTFDLPIDSVEITITALKRRMMSTADGQFRFEKIPPGEYEVRARKIGYAPQVRKFVVADSGGTGAFELMPFAVGLAPVITSASRHGLSGVVGDTGFRAIAHAEVRLPGHDLVTETDALGEFFLPAKPGRYMVSIHRQGFADRLLSVRVPDDSGRRVTVTLLPAHAMPINWLFNVSELSSRLTRTTDSYSSFFTRDDLRELGIEWIYDAVVMAARNPYGVDHGCAVAKNGGPEFLMLDELTIDDIESLEVYRSNTPFQSIPDKPQSRLVGKKGVADSKPAIPIENYGKVSRANFGKLCPVVYVWTR